MKTTLILILALSFNLYANPVETSSAQRDGLQTRVSAQTHAELMSWATSTKAMLEDLRQTVSRLPVSEQIRTIAPLLQHIVDTSGDSSNQLLMRYALNRAGELVGLINREYRGNPNTRGREDIKLRIYLRAVEIALDYYQSDVRALESTGNLFSPYARFGVEFAAHMLTISKSIMDASAQYFVIHKTLQYLRSDLSKDVHAQAYAEDYRRIHQAIVTNVLAENLQDRVYSGAMQRLKRAVEVLSLTNERGQFLTTSIQEDQTSLHLPSTRFAASLNQIRGETEAPQTLERTTSDSHRYKISDGNCYRLDSNRQPYGDGVAIGYCVVGYSPGYGQDGGRRCYAHDTARTHFGRPVDDSYCHSGEYITAYSAGGVLSCYHADKNNREAYGEPVSNEICIVGYKTALDIRNMRRCYGVDSRNQVIGLSVADSLCHAE